MEAVSVAQLRLVDFLVNRTGRQEFFVRTLCNNTAFVNHDDLVGFQDGADALCHHKTGMARAYFFPGAS